MKKNKLFLLVPLLYMVCCTVLLTLPGQAFPEENWFSTIALDKWIHIGMFGLMVIVCCWGLSKTVNIKGPAWGFIIKVGIACLAYGIAMEFVQRYWVINRSFDTGDILADGVGASIGVLVSHSLYRKK